MTPRTFTCLGLVAAGFAATPARAQVVFDPYVYARQLAQMAEMTKQLETMKEGLDTARQQLGQAKQLYDSFNQITSAGDVAGLLNRDEFRRTLPPEFAQIERVITGSGGSSGLSGLVDAYLDRNRHYAGTGGANGFYQAELDRIARATGTKHGVGQQVYDAAAKRIDGLEELRRRIGAAPSVAEKLDLGNRLQAETALLQNEVLRMQGLAMIQGARSEMDAQRERERRQQTADEMKAAVR